MPLCSQNMWMGFFSAKEASTYFPRKETDFVRSLAFVLQKYATPTPKPLGKSTYLYFDLFWFHAALQQAV